MAPSISAMARWAAVNAPLALLAIGALTALSTTPDCEKDGKCQAEQGEALLQKRQVTQRMMASELSEKSEKKGRKKSGKAKQAVLNGHEPAFHISGVPVYGALPLALSELQPPHDTKRDWIIMLKEDATDEEEHAFCSYHGLSCALEGHPDSGGVPFVEMSLTDAELQMLVKEHEGRVTFVEAVTTVQLSPEMPNDPNGPDYAPLGALLELTSSTDYPWGIKRVRADLSRGEGSGVNVYVLDTGLNIHHNDFGGRAFAALDMTNNVQDVCDPSNASCARDMHGHGTHCAGTIAGNVHGVASGASVHGVKVLGDSGSGFTHWIVGGIDWVVASGAKPAVISMSLGGSGTTQSYKAAINAATAHGVTVVVAAGNDQDNACDYSPAFVPNAITVGSSTSQDSRSWFSNWGECLDMFAPGSNIKSAAHDSNTSLSTLSGTSMACPHVSGAAAWLLGQDSTLSPSQIMDRLREVGDHGLISDSKCGSYNLVLTLTESGNSEADAPAPTCAPTPECVDSNNGALDPYGDGCAAYDSTPAWCGGQYDDNDFSSDVHCCGCGGGVDPSICHNTDFGALDPYGDDCADYVQSPGWCGGNYDDADFSSDVHCCVCGGGGAGPAPPTPAPDAPTTTPAPPPPPPPCTDTDNGATDPFGDSCADYSSNPGWCGPDQYDDHDFSNSVMCCACDGGLVGLAQANATVAKATKAQKAGKAAEVSHKAREAHAHKSKTLPERKPTPAALEQKVGKRVKTA